jgi:hypothetical protein
VIEQMDFHLSNCTSLVQFDVKIWFLDIFDEHEDRYMFCGEHIEPINVNLIVEKHFIRYMKGTIDYGLKYISEHERTLQGIHRFILGRQCHKPEKYIWMFL